MGNIDRNYLEIQFRLKVYEKNATLFQSFFEDIMQKAFPDFQKVSLYGKVKAPPGWFLSKATQNELDSQLSHNPDNIQTTNRIREILATGE